MAHDIVFLAYFSITIRSDDYDIGRWSRKLQKLNSIAF